MSMKSPTNADAWSGFTVRVQVMLGSWFISFGNYTRNRAEICILNVKNR